MLTTLVLLPWAGALLAIAGMRWEPRIETSTRTAVFVSAATLLAAIATWIRLSSAEGARLAIRWTWLSSVHTELTADHLAMVFVLLTSTVVLAATLLLAAHATDTMRTRLGFAGVLATEGAANLLFMAGDLVTFQAAWEMTALFTVALVAAGTRGRSGAAALRMLIYLAAGSVGMMLAGARLAAIHHATTGLSSLSLLDIGSTSLPPAVQTWVAIAIVAACAVRIPLVPLHGWLGPVMIAADPAVAIVVAAVLVKTGLYGLLRLAGPLTSDALTAFAQPLFWMSVATLLAAAFAAVLQMEMRRLVGWLTMGGGAMATALVAVDAMRGDPMVPPAVPAQAFIHTIAIATLLVVAGAFEARRTAMHHREIGGAGTPMPRWAVALTLAAVTAIVAPLLVALPILTALVDDVTTRLVGRGWAMALVVASLAAWPLGLSRPIAAACGRRPIDRNRGLRDLTGFELAAVAVLLVSIVVAVLGA